MYTVLIAEDELLVRIGVFNCVPWSKLDMHIVDEVADGMAAWNAYQQYKPDIIITDIRMPEMDGLELLRRIREVDSMCAIIVVTNVENEETMEELRKLNPVSILLKAVMTRENIVDAVIRARDSIGHSPRNTTVEMDHRDLWNAFLLDKAFDYGVLCQRFAERGSSPEQVKGMVLVHLFLEESDARRLKYSMVDIVEHRLQETTSFSSVETAGGALLLLKKDVKRTELEYALKELAWYIDTHFAVKVCFVVQTACKTQHHLPDYAAQALKLTKEPAYFDEPVFLLDGTGRADFHKLRRAACLLKRFEALSHQSKYSAAACGVRLEKLLELLGTGWDAVSKEGAALMNAFGKIAGWEGIHALLNQLTEAAEASVSQMRAHTRPEILSAIEYIEDHLNDDLSIQSVSRIVNYHYAYFSNLFKKEMGMNYSDFVANARINHAKSMLSTSDCTLQEIADECGFKNVAYFCSKFKHVTGMTPGQWREKT